MEFDPDLEDTGDVSEWDSEGPQKMEVWTTTLRVTRTSLARHSKLSHISKSSILIYSLASASTSQFLRMGTVRRFDKWAHPMDVAMAIFNNGLWTGR